MRITSPTEQVFDVAGGTTSRSLLTREQGRNLRSQVLKRLELVDRLTLDLTTAQDLSPSFADELFAGLEAELGQFSTRLTIKCPNAEWRRLITSAMQHRRSQRAR